MIGAYRAINRMIIERELKIQSITSYLTKLIVNVNLKEGQHQSQRTISDTRNLIRVNARARKIKRPTPQEQLEQWLTLEGLNNESSRQATFRSEENNWHKLKKYLKDQDNKAWEEYRQGEIERNPQYSVITNRCDKGRLERYKNLTAAEAVIYV